MNQRIHTFMVAGVLAAVASQGIAIDVGYATLRRLPPTHNVGDIDATRALTHGSSLAIYGHDFTVVNLAGLPAREAAIGSKSPCGCPPPCPGSCVIVPPHKFTGFIDLNDYWDDRDFNVMTINAGAKLPHDFEYFQFLNLYGDMGSPDGREDWRGFLTNTATAALLPPTSKRVGDLVWNT